MRAFVLKKIPFGDSDWIVHFYSEKNQIVAGFATKGRVSRRRFPHQFHIGGLYEIDFGKPLSEGVLGRLKACELIDCALGLGENLEALARWSMVLEWVSWDVAHPVDFDELDALRLNLAQNSKTLKFHDFFLNQMKRHGVAPELHRCVHCHRLVDDEICFSLHGGGVCHPGCERGLMIQSATLRYLQDSFLKLPATVEPTGQLSQELDRIAVPFLEQQLGSNLKSRAFFEQVHPRLRSLA